MKSSCISIGYCDVQRQSHYFPRVATLFIIFALVLIVYKGINCRTSYYSSSISQFRTKSFKKLIMQIQNSTISAELAELSVLMQESLSSFEENHDCHSPAIKCGNYYTCGFGCQIHHRMVCLMIAYALNRTLLHNYVYKWPYERKWPDTFRHLTTRCKTRPETLNVNLKTNPPEITEFESGNQIEFPLKNGIVVPGELTERLEKVHRFPFLWWIGQFAHYTMKLDTELENFIDEAKANIEFQSPIVGVHIRRTDKINEKHNLTVFHKLDEYMEVAHTFYSTHYPKLAKPWRIFLASEDVQVFDELKSRYGLPKWNIIGIKPNMTTENWRERHDFLDEVIRDVTLLSQCDLVICGFSSNVCRLVYELMQARGSDSTNRVLSLDFKYSYIYSNHKLNQTVLDIL